MKDYVKVNKKVYDRVAEQYERKSAIFKRDYNAIMKPFQERLTKKFGKGASVICVGCGTGRDMRSFANKGFDLYGIDVSRNMAKIAERNVPEAKIMVGDFLTKRFSRKFDGVSMTAFVHLFPKRDERLIIKKVASILVPGGYCIMTTAMHSKPKEGYAQKRRYRNVSAKRFRRFWTTDEFVNSVKNVEGLELVDFYLKKTTKKWRETWMILTFRKIR